MSTEQIGFACTLALWVFQAGAMWQKVASLEAQVARLSTLLDRALGFDAGPKTIK